jgi:hypothetical protein
LFDLGLARKEHAQLLDERQNRTDRHTGQSIHSPLEIDIQGKTLLLIGKSVV